MSVSASGSCSSSAGGGNPSVGSGASLSCSALFFTVIERIRAVLRFGSIRRETSELTHLCASLARCIDYAAVYNEVPPLAESLPDLLKQIFFRKHDIYLRSCLVLLMSSVKNACGCGWFSDKDKEELLTLTNELSKNFVTPGVVTLTAHSALDIISEVMRRFFPQLKLCNIIISRQVKMGYEILMSDFFFHKNMLSSPQERMHLFVAQTDKIETSVSIISPPEVNFILNGKGIEKRFLPVVDIGPQLPTDISSLLVPGTNLLQAVGHFNGNYIVAVASMRILSSSSLDATQTMLQDYIQPPAAASALSSDGEVIEGPSRISLNCPISFRRMKTPVKGHLCRHHQCFDYENYMEMNARRPSWRCPHCNQPASFIDICIDQVMVKILNEAGKDVVNVLISGDGSWKSVTDEHAHNGNTHSLQCQDGRLDTFVMKDSLCESEKPTDHVVDLTTEISADDWMRTKTDAFEFGDRKLSDNRPENLPGFLNKMYNGVDLQATSSTLQACRNDDVRSIFCTRPNLSNPCWAICEATVACSSTLISTSSGLCTLLAPVIASTCSGSPSREIHQPVNTLLGCSHNGQLITADKSSVLHPQQARLENSISSGVAECGGTYTMHRHGTRLPTAVQSWDCQDSPHGLPSPCSSQPIIPGDAWMTPTVGQQQRAIGGNKISLPQQPFHYQTLLSPNMRESQLLHLSGQNNFQQPSTYIYTMSVQNNLSGYQQRNLVNFPQMPFASSQAVRPGLQGMQSFLTPVDSLRQATTIPEPLQRSNFLSLHEMPSEHDWRPIEWIRGNLTGRAYSADPSQLTLHPTSVDHLRQPVTVPSLPAASTQLTTSIQQLQHLIAITSAHGQTFSRDA